MWPASVNRADCKGSVLDDTDAALARCSLNLGDGPAAANMYMQVLQRTGEKHLGVSLYYYISAGAREDILLY